MTKGQEMLELATITQHIAWLKQYVEGMDEYNWKDMRLRAERQLESLSEALAQPQSPPHHPMMLDLAEAGIRHAEGLTVQLAKPEFRPSRAHVEQARNSIVKLAGLLRLVAQPDTRPDRNTQQEN
jgi:hypothetical protein